MFKNICLICLLGLIMSCSTKFKRQEIAFYQYDEDKALMGDLWRLKSNKNKLPVVFVVHGGSWSSRKKNDMNGISKSLAKSGFAVFNISYCFAPKHPFPAAIEDFKTAVMFLKENADKYNLDFNHLAVWGYSAGAQVAVLGAMQLQDTIKFDALVSGAGPMNLTLYPNDKAIKKYLNTTIEESPEKFKEASPYFQVNSNSAPMFFYHSKEDTVVDFKHTKEMIKKLKENNVKTELYQVPYFDHFLTFLLDFKSVKQGIKFIKKQMKE